MPSTANSSLTISLTQDRIEMPKNWEDKNTNFVDFRWNSIVDISLICVRFLFAGLSVSLLIEELSFCREFYENPIRRQSVPFRSLSIIPLLQRFFISTQTQILQIFFSYSIRCPNKLFSHGSKKIKMRMAENRNSKKEQKISNPSVLHNLSWVSMNEWVESLTLFSPACSLRNPSQLTF